MAANKMYKMHISTDNILRGLAGVERRAAGRMRR